MTNKTMDGYTYRDDIYTQGNILPLDIMVMS